MSFKPIIKVLKTTDNFNNLVKNLDKISNIDVLIGIPQEKAENNDGMTNAQLLYIHSKGSPINNLVPRPTVEPTIEQEKEKISICYGNAFNKGLKGQEMTEDLNKLGLYLTNKVKSKFGSDELEPLKESTKKQKARKIVKSKKSKTVKDLRAEFIEGSGNPLIDTGQLRNSITYVIRNKNND